MFGLRVERWHSPFPFAEGQGSRDGAMAPSLHKIHWRITMLDWRRRPVGRLFYWTLVLMSALGFGLPASEAAVPPDGGAPTTTVTDTVYLADGTPASGN